MKIINNTSFDYEVIGTIIDIIMSDTQGTTHYVGQIEWTILEINGHKITINDNLITIEFFNPNNGEASTINMIIEKENGDK